MTSLLDLYRPLLTWFSTYSSNSGVSEIVMSHNTNFWYCRQVGPVSGWRAGLIDVPSEHKKAAFAGLDKVAWTGFESGREGLPKVVGGRKRS